MRLHRASLTPAITSRSPDQTALSPFRMLRRSHRSPFIVHKAADTDAPRGRLNIPMQKTNRYIYKMVRTCVAMVSRSSFHEADVITFLSFNTREHSCSGTPNPVVHPLIFVTFRCCSQVLSAIQPGEHRTPAHCQSLRRTTRRQQTREAGHYPDGLLSRLFRAVVLMSHQIR